ncbi:MAG: octanoyltransferase [Phycisphaerae bacterium]|jgi:lipoate-protein ligase B|nr:MAG: octanoyltransferase [Phycisphaerae bacterium]
MRVIDLGTMDYRSAWQVQLDVHEQVRVGGEEAICLVEHSPVITLGRRSQESLKHLAASRECLHRLGVELVESDRGGDITFHGPGQLVVYPIVRLSDHRLSVGGYVKCLERAVLRTVERFGIRAHLDPGAIGVWTQKGKICALGVRIKRGVSMHGVALNVTTDLRWFDLIVPCGLPGRGVTSMQQWLGDQTPGVEQVKSILVSEIVACVKTGGRNNASV